MRAIDESMDALVEAANDGQSKEEMREKAKQNSIMKAKRTAVANKKGHTGAALKKGAVGRK